MPESAKCPTARNARRREMPNGAGRKGERRGASRGRSQQSRLVARPPNGKAVLGDLCDLRGPIAVGARGEVMSRRDGRVTRV